MPEQYYDVSPTLTQQRRQLPMYQAPRNVEAYRHTLLRNIKLPDGHTPQSELTSEDLQDLTNGTLRLINLCIQDGYDTIFFLDRSSRPAAWLFRDVWRKLYPTIPPPRIRYINVGTNQEGMETMLNEKRESTLQQLRNRYHADKFHPENILVADEYSSTGESSYRAAGIVKGIFPEANVGITGIFEIPPLWTFANNKPELFHVEERPDSRSKDEIAKRIQRVWSVDDYFVQKKQPKEEHSSDSNDKSDSKQKTHPENYSGMIFREELRALADVIVYKIQRNPIPSTHVSILEPKREKSGRGFVT